MRNNHWNRFGLALAVALGTVCAQENYSLWSGSRDYSLNTGNSGAKVTGTVTNFPVLVRLGAPEGAPCELSCDCRIGLQCVEGTCASHD